MQSENNVETGKRKPKLTQNMLRKRIIMKLNAVNMKANTHLKHEMRKLLSVRKYGI